MDSKKRLAAILDLTNREKAGQLSDDESLALGYLRLNGVAPPADASIVDSSFDAAMIGAGRSATNIGRGVQGLFADDREQAQLDAELAESERFAQPLKDEFPVASALGESLPYAAVPMGVAAGPLARLGMAGKATSTVGPVVPKALQVARSARLPLAEAAATGAVLGALDPTQSAVEGALGGAVGHKVGELAGRATERLLSPELMPREGIEQAFRNAEEMGFQLTPGEVTGNRSMALLEATADAMPIVSGAIRNPKEYNQALANGISAKAIGERSRVVTQETLGTARQRIGQEFEDVIRGREMELDQTFIDELAQVEDEFSRVWGGGSDRLGKILDSAVDEAATNGGIIPAGRYQQLRSNLRERAQSILRSTTGDSHEGLAVFRVMGALDAAMERSMGPDAAAAFREARRKYRNLMVLESPGVTNPSSGDISPANLGRVLARKDVQGFLRGDRIEDEELYQLGQLGQAFKAQIGTSGTGERLLTGGLVGGMTVGAMTDPGLAATVAGGLAVGRGGMEAYRRSMPYWGNAAARGQIAPGAAQVGRGAGASQLGAPEELKHDPAAFRAFMLNGPRPMQNTLNFLPQNQGVWDGGAPTPSMAPGLFDSR